MSYKVRINTFEGPFDLLVYLIENAQMNIYDIKISQITKQYLDCIDEMKKQDIIISMEFMVLAATLIEIKSKMILPRTTIDGEVQLEDDPRGDLVQRLLEYKKFKSAAEILTEREEFSSYIYEKPQEDISMYLDSPDEYLSLDSKQFTQAFKLFLSKKKQVESVKKHYQKVEREKISVEAKIGYILNALSDVIGKSKQIFNFKEFVQEKENRYDIAVTFSSVLQLLKDKKVSAEQKYNFADIYIREFQEENKIDE